MTDEQENAVANITAVVVAVTAYFDEDPSRVLTLEQFKAMINTVHRASEPPPVERRH